MAHLLRMPAVAANAVEAVLSEWPVPENTPFAADDVIATIETEKAVVDVPAEAAGVILKTLVPTGAEVQIGAPIALLGAVGEVVEDVEDVLAELGAAPAQPAAHGLSGSAPPAPLTRTGGRIFSSPLARRLAKEAGLPIAELAGTGPGGRIVRRDVERAIADRGALASRPIVEPVVETRPPVATVAAPPPAAAPGTYDDIPHTTMRRAIAARLTQSVRDAPHFSLAGTARVDALLELRAKLNEYAPTKISINDLVVLAAARAHVLVPAMNVVWMPDAVRKFSTVDIAVAVSTDRGLVTPVLRGIERMTVSAVAAANRDLVDRARAGRLREDELAGGTLTVTNLGVFGTESFAAIINPPQSAILAVGAARQEPVVRDGELAVATVVHVTLSVDHRPVDGALAAEWMAAFLSLLQEPLRVLA